MASIRSILHRNKAVLGLVLSLTAIYLVSSSGSTQHFGLRHLGKSQSPYHVTDGYDAEGLQFLHPHEEEHGDDKMNGWMELGSWLPGKQDRPLLLMTGGAGQLGQALLPTLTETYTVHILDILPKPSTLPPGVVYHRGSVLPPSQALPELFASYTWSGILHLAAISLDSWCSPKETECLKVNSGGTAAITHLLEKSITRRTRDTPWVIYASSMDVFGDDARHEHSTRKPITALGRTKLQGEEVIEKMFENIKYNGQHKISTIILRFADVYGYSPKDGITQSFFPSLLVNAITSRTIQYDSDIHPTDYLHISDAITGVSKAIKHVIQEKERGNPAKLEHVNLVSGTAWTQTQLVERVVDAVDSKSPLRDIGTHQAQDQITHGNSHAAAILDWHPEITIREGLSMAIRSMTTSLTTYAREYLSDHCNGGYSSSLSGIIDRRKQSTGVEDLRNKDLYKLDGCTVQLGFDHEGFIHHFKCSDGKHCTADGVKVNGYNWNSSTWIVHRSNPKSKGQDRKVTISLEEENGKGWLGVYKDQAKEHREIGFELMDKDHQGSRSAIFDFDVEVAEDSASLRLMLPENGRQIHAVANVTEKVTWFSLDYPEHLGKHFDMRMNVLCCPREGDWPLLQDDFETADIRFGKTAQIPFDSSKRTATCARAAKALEHIQNQHYQVSKRQQEQTRSLPPTSNLPHQWSLRELPTCWNDCNSPTICVQTGDCRCVEAECPLKRENPLLTLKRGSAKYSDPSKSPLGDLAGNSAILSTAVQHKDITDLLLPQAKSYIQKYPDFIKVHVADGYEGEEEIESSSCHLLQDRHCFSADSILYRAMRHIQVPASEAELIVLPVYQQCKGAEFMLHNVTHHAEAIAPEILSGNKRMMTVLTHDWGICIAFAWEMWSARDVLYPDWILDNTLVLSVMGDHDSPCYRPHMDVVIPARSCQSNHLKETFGDINEVKPIRERSHLLTWSGTYWGTGKSERLRWTCERGGAGTRELIKGKGRQSIWYDWDYMKNLDEARFCPQPRGIAGWSPRLNDAIYAGCIPVLTADGTHYPYADVLDWTKFSVRVSPTDLDHIEQILEAIPIEKVEEMQANLAIIREGFLYSTDEHPEEELTRKGPMWFALHSAGMRLKTMYPTN